jgi:hypothetical protein
MNAYFSEATRNHYGDISNGETKPNEFRKKNFYLVLHRVSGAEKM